MKHILFLFWVLIVANTGRAQLSEPHQPPSWNTSISSIDNLSIVVIDAPDMSEVYAIRNAQKHKNTALLAGKKIPVQVNFLENGTWNVLPNNSLVCRTKITAKNAGHVGVNFSELYLPIGGELYFYSPDFKNKIGPFTQQDVAQDGSFSSGVIEGSEIIIELVQPARNNTRPIVDIESLIYLVKERKSASRDFGDADDCHINVNCKEGDNWRDQQNAVVRILMYINGEYGWCTGTIMNNTFQDCTPYILTADHCRSVKAGSVAAETDYDQWQFYFNYEGPKCKNPKESEVAIGTLTGCKKMANSGKMAEGDPDFLLVKLNSAIPQFYNPFFAGWDNRNLASSSGVMIHHPQGDVKKISTYTSTLESSQWNENNKNTHWKLYWAETSNGRGVSQSGSSGSALWNSDKRVLGQLTGGSSGCTDDGTTSPYNPDYFGKMSAGWFMNGEVPSLQLKAWLDEGNSLRSFIDGIKWPCAEDPLTAMSVIEKSEEIKLYPNPANKTIRVDLKGLFQNKIEFSIINSLGTKIGSTESTSSQTADLNIDDLPKGLYILEISSGGEVIRKTFIKE